MRGANHSAAGVFTALLFASALDSPHAIAQSLDKWGAHLDLEGKLGTERSLGEGGLFLPLAQTERTLAFGDIRMRFDDSESREANLGAGVRHMLESGWNVGGYGYFDRRGSGYGNYFNQLTFGAEALGRDFDVRANSYWAIGERNRAVDALSTAEISGTSIFLRGGEERSMSGFDAEVGWRLPLYDAEAPRQLRLYVGGYRFTAGGVDDVTGPRLRADFAFSDLPLPWDGATLNLGAEWQHDEPRGSQAFASIRLRIPFQREAASPRLTAQERRMTETVIRDIDVVTQAGAFGAPEAVTQTASGQIITVINSASTAGADLPTAVANAGNDSTVILSGSFATTAAVVVSAGQTVIGGGSLQVRSPSGRTAQLALARATVANSVSGSGAFAMSPNSTLSGIDMSALDGSVVDVSTIDNVTISNNRIVGTASGGAPATGIAFNGTNGVIRNNVIMVNSTGGVSTARALSIGGATNLLVTGNSLSATDQGGGSYVVSVGFTDIAAGSTGNVNNGGGCEIQAGSNSGQVGFTNGTTCP